MTETIIKCLRHRQPQPCGGCDREEGALLWEMWKIALGARTLEDDVRNGLHDEPHP